MGFLLLIRDIEARAITFYQEENISLEPLDVDKSRKFNSEFPTNI